MRPESAKLLNDMRDAGKRISAYTNGMTRDVFLAQPLVRDAVNWNFSVLGEALAQLHKSDPLTAERINEWKRIVAFRNQLIHGYGVIKNEITWDIVENKLPILLADLQKLLALPSIASGHTEPREP